MCVKFLERFEVRSRLSFAVRSWLSSLSTSLLFFWSVSLADCSLTDYCILIGSDWLGTTIKDSWGVFKSAISASLRLLVFLTRLEPTKVTADEFTILIGLAAIEVTLTVEDCYCWADDLLAIELFLVAFPIKTTLLAGSIDSGCFTVIWFELLFYYSDDILSFAGAGSFDYGSAIKPLEAAGTFKVTAARAPFLVAAIFAACFCWAFSVRRAAAASLRF